MKCINCGFEINTNSKFCPKCGTSVKPTTQSNNIDPDATVAVNNDIFKTQGSEYIPPAAPPVFEDIPAADDLDATVAANSIPSVQESEDDLNATVAVSHTAFTEQPAEEVMTPPVYDNNIQENNLDDTVRIDPNNTVVPPVIPPRNNKPPQKEKKKNKALIIILSVIGAIIVIAGILVGLMFADVIPNIFAKDDKKTEQKQNEDEEETEESTDESILETEPSLLETEPVTGEEPTPDTPDTPDTPITPDTPDTPDTPAVLTLSEDILEGSWTGNIDIGEYFEGLAEGIELPKLPVNGTYTFDGNGTLTRTLDTQQLSTMLSLLAESNDSSIIALLAYTASAFDGDKTFNYTIKDNQVIIGNERSVLVYTEDSTLEGILAGCELELEKNNTIN